MTRIAGFTIDPPWLGQRFAEIAGVTASGEIIFSVTAGEAISGHRAIVIKSDGLAWLADQATDDALIVAGVSLTAATAGNTVTFKAGGKITEPSWNWTSVPIWLEGQGMLSQTAPSSGLLVKLGTPLGPQSMRVAAQIVARI